MCLTLHRCQRHKQRVVRPLEKFAFALPQHVHHAVVQSPALAPQEDQFAAGWALAAHQLLGE
jgi:hypothetical protein